jgi:hypothetical protein
LRKKDLNLVIFLGVGKVEVGEEDVEVAEVEAEEEDLAVVVVAREDMMIERLQVVTLY